MNNPWHALKTEWPRVRVYVRYSPDRWGQTIWPDTGSPYIELAHDLGRIQRRCTVAHELHHLAVGKPCASFCDTNERRVVEDTARWLLPDLADVGRALAEHDMETAAELLSVTVEVLNDRLDTMTAAEEKELGALLAESSDSGLQAAHGAPRRTVDPPARCKGRHGAGRPTRTSAGPEPDARPALS